MATRTISKTDIVGLQSISFVRPIPININVTGMKPLTRMYAFFDGISIDQYIFAPSDAYTVLTPSTTALTTDSNGSMSVVFRVPPMTFNTGSKKILIQDNPVFDYSNISGSVVGQASGVFVATGLLQTVQETINNITTVISYNDLPAPFYFGDPLAQSFFTYGISGGCFVTSIDVFFNTVDSVIPITLQIRKMVNGYPSTEIVSKFSSVTILPTAVSSNASLPTNFKFTRPIYLNEDSDYCFVLLANSNKYNVFTSKMGEKSIESGSTIFEQPYIGSLFKSENNVTWTAEQSQDIKFTINKAKFKGYPAYMDTNVLAPKTILFGSNFTLTSGSSSLVIKLPFQHEYKVGDLFVMDTVPLSVYATGGTTINATVLSYPMTISNVASDGYTITVGMTSNGTTAINSPITGNITRSGLVDNVIITSAGTSNTDYAALVFVGACTTSASGFVRVFNNKVVDVIITNHGSGYISDPTVSVDGGNATLSVVSEAVFAARVNRKYHSYTPIVVSTQPPGTSIEATLTTSKLSSGAYSTVSATKADINKTTFVNNQYVLVTDTTGMSSYTTGVKLQMTTDNPNVSPTIDYSEKLRLRTNNIIINSGGDGGETTDTTTGAKAKYVSKIVTLETASTGVRLITEAASVSTCSMRVFIRTSLTGELKDHRLSTNTWKELTCSTGTNISKSNTDFKDYEFYLDNISPFDVYDIKIVLNSTNQYTFPILNNYRTIILAT